MRWSRSAIRVIELLGQPHRRNPHVALDNQEVLHAATPEARVAAENRIVGMVDRANYNAFTMFLQRHQDKDVQRAAMRVAEAVERSRSMPAQR